MSAFFDRGIRETINTIAGKRYGSSPELLANTDGFTRILLRHGFSVDFDNPETNEVIEQLSNKLNSLIEKIYAILSSVNDPEDNGEYIQFSSIQLQKVTFVLFLYNHLESNRCFTDFASLSSQQKVKLVSMVDQYDHSELSDMIKLAKELSRIIEYFMGVLIITMNNEQGTQIQRTEEDRYQQYYDLFSDQVFSALTDKWKEIKGKRNKTKRISQYWKDIIIAELNVVSSLEHIDRLKRFVKEVFFQDEIIQEKLGFSLDREVVLDVYNAICDRQIQVKIHYS